MSDILSDLAKRAQNLIACSILRLQHMGEIMAYEGYARDFKSPALTPEERQELHRIADDEINDHAHTEHKLMEKRGCPLNG